MSRFVRGVTLVGLFIVATTELLSLARSIDRPSIAISWLVAGIAAAFVLRRGRNETGRVVGFRPADSLEWALLLGITLIVGGNLILAVFTAPNAWDAVTYHLPRISHWIANKSVAHYPTHIDRQLWISPGHEFVALHLELLTGTRRLVNVVQWLASIGCAVVAAGICHQFGAGRKGVLFAALFTVTLPMAVAQASGSQVDLFAAFWIAVSVYLLLDSVQGGRATTLLNAGFIGAAFGLAVLAKSTAVLVLFPFAIWAGVTALQRSIPRGVASIVIVCAITLGVNAGHVLRNKETFGHPLVNPRGATVVNERFGFRVTVSNLVRNITVHTSTRWTALNVPQRRIVNSLHDALGLSPSDTATTFLGGPFRLVRRPRTEVFAGAGIHLLVGMGLLLFAGRRGRLERRPTLLYGMMILAGFVLFCAVLKWQPFHARLHLSYLILLAPLYGIAAGRISRRACAIAAAVLFVAAMPMLLRNAARPAADRQSIFLMPRERQYFNQLHWIYEPTVKAAQFLADRKCVRVGLLSSWGDPEETLWEAMRNRASEQVEIVHVGIPPDRYPPGRTAPDQRVCAIVGQYAFPGGLNSSLPVPEGFVLALDEGMVRVYLPDSPIIR